MIGQDDCPAQAHLVDLLQDFAKRPPLELVSLELAESLLQLAKGSEATARRLTEATPPAWEATLIADVSDAVSAATVAFRCSALLTTALLAELVDLVRAELTFEQAEDRGLEQLVVPVLAHAVAEGLDIACHDAWHSYWATTLTVEIRAGRVHPVADHDPRPRLGTHKANTRRDHLASPPLHATTHLRIGSEEADRWRIRVSYDIWGHAAPVVGETGPFVLAACQPNVTLAESVVEKLPGDLVHHQGFVDPAGQRQLLLDCVRAAHRAGAHFVVLPEYSLHADDRDAFRDALRQEIVRPMVIVSGSSEVRDPITRHPENDALALITDSLAVHQKKMTPAVLGLDTEGVYARRDLAVYRAEHFTLAILICRDASSPQLLTLLAELGVSVLLVPAFSPRTGSIIQLASSLSTLSQAFVTVAIGPAVWSECGADVRGTPGLPDRVEAAFSGPYETYPERYVAPQQARPAPGPGPAVYLFNTSTRTLTAVPVDAQRIQG